MSTFKLPDVDGDVEVQLTGDLQKEELLKFPAFKVRCPVSRFSASSLSEVIDLVTPSLIIYILISATNKAPRTGSTA